MDLEVFLFENLVTQVESVRKIKVRDEPALFWIKEMHHCIVLFPDLKIFNCNPRDYPISSFKPKTEGLDDPQVEPESKEYQRFSDEEGEIFEVEKNCLLWSAYYLWWWKNRPTPKFETGLSNLARWCRDHEERIISTNEI